MQAIGGLANGMDGVDVFHFDSKSCTLEDVFDITKPEVNGVRVGDAAVNNVVAA